MNLVQQQQLALRRMAEFATPDEPLGPHTTYRVGGPALVYATPRTLEDLKVIGEVAQDAGLPVLSIGRGSNLLVADAGFAGIVVSLSALGERIEFDGSTVSAGGAVALPVLARRCVAAGLVGFEWAVGVPGSVGGAVRMNAGGHGSDMAASLVGVHVFDLRSTEQVWLPVDALGLGFRSSDLGDHQVVIDACLQLSVGDAVAAEATLSEIVRWRREHQPGGQNAGSVFVNPIPGELPAAVLIDRLGLRGFRIGGAFVSEKHANFIQATDGATAGDVRAVMQHVRAAVLESSGHLLRTEVRLVGFELEGVE